MQLHTLEHAYLLKTSCLYENLSLSQVLHFNQTGREESSSETTRPSLGRPKNGEMACITTKDSEK